MSDPVDIKVTIARREVTGKKLLDIDVNGFITTISEKETKMETDRAIDKSVIDLVKREFHIKAHDAISILERNQLPIGKYHSWSSFKKSNRF